MGRRRKGKNPQRWNPTAKPTKQNSEVKTSTLPAKDTSIQGCPTSTSVPARTSTSTAKSTSERTSSISTSTSTNMSTSIASVTSLCSPDKEKKEMPLKERIKKNCCKKFDMKEGLLVGKLEMKVDHKDEKNKVQKLFLGKPTNLTTKVILLVGATGTGKTTLINAMANYIFGVNFDDEFRFTLIDDKEDPNRSEALSQTDFITAFTFHNLSGMPFGFNYILIDTPGFGDTRGINRDREMMTQIETFLKQDYGIDQVDGVGFVVPASATRLTQTQKYVLDGLASIFGKDIKSNIFVMATFADARKPPVLKALAEAGMEYGEVYKFNNSALYARNKVEKFQNDDESDDEETVSMSSQYWEMAIRSMSKFFTKLGQMSPVSLTLTKEVLEERKHLQTVLYSLQTQIQLGLNKLSVLNQERHLLAMLDDDMKGSKNHFMDIEVPEIKEVRLNPNECVTNCLKCSCTCHFPCHLPQTQDKKRCSAMRNGVCKVCPGKCEWDVHSHMNFRYETTWKKERRTAQELLIRYNKAFIGKLTKENAIHKIEEDINNHSKILIQMIKDIQRHVHRLEEIALKPNPLSTKEYIDLMVESEKMQKNYNFEKRIKMLLTLKEEVQILEAATGVAENLPDTGEALLTYFQDLMVS